MAHFGSVKVINIIGGVRGGDSVNTQVPQANRFITSFDQ